MPLCLREHVNGLRELTSHDFSSSHEKHHIKIMFYQCELLLGPDAPHVSSLLSTLSAFSGFKNCIFRCFAPSATHTEVQYKIPDTCKTCNIELKCVLSKMKYVFRAT